MQNLYFKSLVFIVFIAISTVSRGNESENNELYQNILDLQTRPAKVNYQMTGDEQLMAFKSLTEYADVMTQTSHDDAEVWIWNGIILSSYPVMQELKVG
jgi:hypothetical protein